MPTDFGYVFDAAQAKAKAQLAQLVPNAIHVSATTSSHNIPHPAAGRGGRDPAGADLSGIQS